MNRARWLDDEINDKLLQRQTVYDSLTKITQNYDSDGSQSTVDPHKFDKLGDYWKLLDNLTDEYILALKEITETIAKLQDGRQRRVLTLYYTVKDKKTGRPLTWEQVAVILHYSWKQTRRIHAKALCEIDKLIGGD
jgi:hypothetical protein